MRKLYRKKKIKICVISSSRSDFGQLKNLIIDLRKDKNFKLQLLLTGSHFDKKKGKSIKEITLNKLPISAKVNIPIKNDSAIEITNFMSSLLIKISRKFSHLKPNIVLVLGDRYEILIACLAALIRNIPIAHLHGGEVTAGVIDESLRHAITKMSNIHFTANSIFRSRVIKMGEHPKYVFDVGALTAQNIKFIKFKKKEEIEKKFKFKFLKKNLIITLHPEKEFYQTKLIIKNLFDILKKLSEEVLLIFTAPNSDKYSDYISLSIKKFIKQNKNSIFIPNLGYENYLSCMKICNGVLGNSSSGVTETPQLRVGALNIGMRQKGRPLAKNIIQVSHNKKQIQNGIKKIFSKKFQDTIKHSRSFYYKRDTRQTIIKILKKIKLNYLTKNKEFYE